MMFPWYIIVIFVIFAVGAVAWSIYRRNKMNRLNQQQSPLMASPQGFAHTGGGGGATPYTPTYNNDGVYHYDSQQQQQHQQYQQQYGGAVLGQPQPNLYQQGAPAPMHYGTGQESYFPAAQHQYPPPTNGVAITIVSYEQFPTVSSPPQQQGQPNVYGGGNIYTQPTQK